VKLKWENKHGLTPNEEFVAANKMKIDIRTFDGRKKFDEKMSKKTQAEIEELIRGKKKYTQSKGTEQNVDDNTGTLQKKVIF